MLLKDQDRIFQNLYGMGDRSLKGAMSRGCWDNTAELIARGRDGFTRYTGPAGAKESAA